MKKIILVAILSTFVIKGYSQCKTCHDGKHDIAGDNRKAGNALPPDSSGGLALSYLKQNVCGLNWQQSSVLTTTRYSPTPGTGLPCTVPLTFDSCKNVDSVVTAFLYFNGSYQTSYAANPASVTITNPSAQVFTYSADSIGTAGPKCWGDVGTIAYRVDITNCIKGGGNYVVNMTGTGISAWSIDGTTILVVYIDKSATYSGSIALYDGLYTGIGGSQSQTFTGFKVCDATPTGQAFSILADMQSNVNADVNTQTYNNSTASFPNNFYNFCTVTTSLTAGQTATTYSVYTNNGGDCYSWVLSGLYWQNNKCMVCTPSVKGTLSITATPQIDTLCHGDSVQLTASGANTFIWAPATGLSCNNCPNPKASPNSSTTYTVTGFNGCTFGTDTVRILVSPKTAPVVLPANPVICLPGSVQLTVTNGANYVWKPAATLSCNTCSNPIASPTVTTTYTVVSGFNGCKDSTTVTVTVASSPNVGVVPKSPKICNGGSIKLTAVGAANYTWEPAASLNCPICSNPIASPTVTTVYTVVGSNGSCTDTITDTVFIVPPPVPVINPKFDSVCQGDSVVLSGSGGGTYRWSNGKTTTTIKVAPIATTIYTLAVFNGFCSDSTTVTVKITPKTDLVTSIVDSIICPHDSSHLIMRGSGGPVTYKWSTGATTSSITVSDSVTTTYTATVYGVCDSMQRMLKVTVIPLPQPLIKGTNWKCKGVRDTLTVTSSTNPTKYVWSDGKTTTSITTGNINADSTIIVTGYNSLGCPNKDTFKITLRKPPAPAPNVSIFCAGQAVVLTASATGTNPPFTYKWSTGQTGTSITIDPGPESPTTYTVQASNGCIGSASITAIPNIPNLHVCCNQTLIVEDDSAVRNDTTILVASGNSTKYQWQEQPTSGLITCLNPSCDSVKVITTTTTTYTVIGTDANGCTTEQIAIVNIEISCFDLTVPNVFTPTVPGPSGLNSEFYIKTKDLNAWSIVIYDRWGKEVYSSTNQYEYWNGTTESGGKAPDGVYYYIIKGTCQNNTYKKDGFVQLIR